MGSNAQLPDSIPAINDVIGIPDGKEFRLLTAAAPTKLSKSGKDAYTAKASRVRGAVLGASFHQVFELCWTVPENGVSGIDWGQPDSVMPTLEFLDEKTGRFNDSIYHYDTPDGTYVQLTDIFLDACDGKIIFIAEAARQGDVPDELGMLPTYTIRWQLPKSDVYDPGYLPSDRIDDTDWDKPEQVAPSQTHAYSARKGCLKDIRTTSSYNGYDLMDFDVQQAKAAAKLVQLEPTDDNPSGLCIIDATQL